MPEDSMCFYVLFFRVSFFFYFLGQFSTNDHEWREITLENMKNCMHNPARILLFFDRNVIRYLIFEVRVLKYTIKVYTI